MKDIEEKARKISSEIARERGVWARCRHLTLIFDGNRLVSVGTNNRKTNPANLRYRYVNRQMQDISSLVGTHSEMDAVLRIGIENCRGLTLVNTRINRSGLLDLSMPCRGCSEMIERAGFERVIYTDKQGEFRAWPPASSCRRTS